MSLTLPVDPARAMVIPDKKVRQGGWVPKIMDPWVSGLPWFDYQYPHVHCMLPTLRLSWREGVLGQYWECESCFTTEWRKIKIETEFKA